MPTPTQGMNNRPATSREPAASSPPSAPASIRMTALEKRTEKRIRAIYSSQKARAKKYGAVVPYTADELVSHIMSLGRCPYCGVHLTPKGFQIDHTWPIARGGSWRLDNTQAICISCNRRKHALVHYEYVALLKFLEKFHPYARTNILARLAAGGAWLATKF